MNDQTTSPDSYDSPWKEVLENYTQEFTALFFPDAHDDIDWGRGYEFLDKELQQVTRDAVLGQRQADKLVKVWRQGGDEAWVLMHTVWQEVQRYEEANKMDYITSVERIGMRKGMQQGLEQGLEQGKREGLWRAIRLGLDLKFGAAGLPLLSEIYRIDDIALLESITDAIKTVNSPDELRSLYQLASA